MWKALIVNGEIDADKLLTCALKNTELTLDLIGATAEVPQAMDMAIHFKPDIVLVDLDISTSERLDFIDRLRTFLPCVLVIVLTKLRDFEYVQRAIHLKVHDYILKPAPKQRLCNAFKKAVTDLELSKKQNDLLRLFHQQLHSNLPLLREKLMQDFMDGRVSESDLRCQMKLLGAEIQSFSGLLLIVPTEKLLSFMKLNKYDGVYFPYSLEQFEVHIKEIMAPFLTPNITFLYRKRAYISLFSLTETELDTIRQRISEAIGEELKSHIIIKTAHMSDMPAHIKSVCETMMDDVTQICCLSPMTKIIKDYIETNYYKGDLCIHDITSEYNISVSYAGRLLRQELSSSFVEYLTKIRVTKAIRLMHDPFIKINEISNKVGYSDQHYFSNIFKKHMGLPPGEYRKNLARAGSM
ncbi:MAG: helix-turn-helix domain-containing protein [Oscillospiraceae bacterium]|nr:helix-turn-helix domain-containing protein [Oscillospiraceae bacterium]